MRVTNHSVSQILLINGPLDGHYLNIPVVEEDGRLVAIVDVLKLTYATLEQVRSHLYYRVFSYLLTSLSDESPVGRGNWGRCSGRGRRSYVGSLLRFYRWPR